MKKYSPYISAGLVASMFYMLYQLQQVGSTLAKFGETLHNTTILLLFSVCGLLAIGLSLSGFKSLDDNLKYVSYFGFGGSVIILFIVWFFPFFV